MPDFTLEMEHEGPVFGLDEVGRGPLAGPVVAACVYIPEDTYTLPFIPEIQDSKKLSEPRLEKLYGLITQSFEWNIYEVAPAEIDEINIHHASLEAMKKAFLNHPSFRRKPESCSHKAEDPCFRRDDVFALVDGKFIPSDMPCATHAIIKGDSKSTSIAAASIVAKVTRDRIMRALHTEFPHYGWDTNVGYPSQAHRDAIDAHGITLHHRKSYAPVKNFLLHGSTRAPTESAA